MKFWQLMQLTQQANARRHQEANGDAPGEGQKTDKPATNEQPGESKGGDTKPTDAEAKLLREVMSRKEQAQKLAEQNEHLTKQVEELQARFDGVDPEQFRKLSEEAQQRREKELEGNQDWATLKADLEEKHKATIEQVVSQHNEQLANTKSELEKQNAELMEKFSKQTQHIEELTIGNKFGSSKYITEELGPSSTKIRALYGAHFDLVDGQVVPFDKPRGAEKRHPLVDGDGKPLSFDLALQKIVDSDPDGDSIKRAKQRSGSDSSSANRPSAAGEGGSGLSGVSRIQAGLSKG